MKKEFREIIANTTKLGSCYFAIPKAVREVVEKIPAKPIFAGERVGCVQREFKPSPVSLNRLKSTMPIVTVNSKSAWLFVCGRDILAKGIVAHDPVNNGNLALVCDEEGNALGYGQIRIGMKKQIAVLKRLFDLGDYLHRERKNKHNKA